MDSEWRARPTSCRATVRMLEEEVAVLRRRLQDAPRRVRVLEERLLETKGQLAQAASQNEKLTAALEETREQLAVLRDEVEKLTTPPNPFGTVPRVNEDGTADVHTAGRKLRVAAPARHRGQDARAGPGGRSSTSRATSSTSAPSRSTGEVVTVKECSRTAGCWSSAAPTRSGCASSPTPMRGVTLRAGDHVAHRRPHRPGARAAAPGPKSRSWCSRRSPTSPTRTSAASTTRSRRSGTRSSCRTSTRTVRRVRAGAAQGHPPLRAPRLWQDPDRQGGGQQPRQGGGGEDRQRATPAPTSSTSKAPSCSTSTSARPSARSG